MSMRDYIIYFVYRSAVTGKFVSKPFALKNPSITFKQRISFKRRKK